MELRGIIVKTHYKYKESFVETVRKLRGIFGRRNTPNKTTVQRLFKNFKEIGKIVARK